MEKDIEAGVVGSQAHLRIPWMTMLLDQGVVTDEIREYQYEGSGTESDPYLVVLLKQDPRDPMQFPTWLKWCLVQVVAIATLAISFDSSAYASGIPQIGAELGGSNEVRLLGISLFVLGLASGPFLWAPLSELYGRQYLYVGTFTLCTIFGGASIASQNLASALILRFFFGAFGASVLTNGGGVCADLFPASQRGMSMTLFAAAPFLGPVLGPVIGGFLAESAGWRWLFAFMTLFTAFTCVVGMLALPETYAPVLLRKRAQKLSKITGRKYVSKADYEGTNKTSAAQKFKTALSRPWLLLIYEPIVILLTLFQAIVFGTLYLLFAAYPIVYVQVRGWSQGVGGLPFIGCTIGVLVSIGYCIWDNKRYVRAVEASPSGFAPPEERLPPACVGAIAIPIGMFWFAWTNSPSIHWFSSVAAGAPFGFGMVALYLGTVNYLIDSYTIYAASVLATGALGRALFGAIFPLFTTYMYEALGIHWASSVPAFAMAVCAPFPFVMYRFGPSIRKRCRYAAEAELYLQKIRGQTSISLKHPSAVSETEEAPESLQSSSKGTNEK